MFKSKVSSRRLTLKILRFVAILFLLAQTISAPIYASAYEKTEDQTPRNSLVESLPGVEKMHDDQLPDEIERNETQADGETLNEAIQSLSVNLERIGDSDQISIEHEEDLFDYLSTDNLIGLDREATGDLGHIEKIEVDGQTLNQGEYYVNSEEAGQQILIDGNKLHANPPKKIFMSIKASGLAKYSMLLRDQLPARAMLNQEGVFLDANLSDVNLGHRSSGQCEPNGNINTYAKHVNVSAPIYNHNQFRAGELFVTLSGLVPGENINEIVFLQNSNFNISDGARALLFTDEDGRLTKANKDKDNYRTVSNVIARDKGPNEAHQSLILEFPPVKIGQTGEISVVIPSKNAVGYGLRAQVTKILDFGAYADPYQEADLATALPKRELSPSEKYGGTKLYLSENANNAQSGQAGTSLLVQNKGVKDPQIIGTSQWSYNGLAFDQKDNWLYAVSNKGQGENAKCYPAGHLLQIHPVTGKVRNLGSLRGLEGGDVFDNSIDEFGQEILDRIQINAGSIYDGYFYVSNSAETGSKKIYRITPPSKGGFRNGEPVVERTLFESYSSDYVQLPSQDNYLWGMVGTEAKKSVPRWHKLAGFAMNNLLVERINLYSGETDYFEIPAENAKTITKKTISNPKQWGKAWSYGNGNLGFAAEGLNHLDPKALRLEVKNAASVKPEFRVLEIMSDFSNSIHSDSSSNSSRTGFIKSDLKVQKTQLVGRMNSIDQDSVNVLKSQGANNSDYYYWLIDIKNVGNGASSGSVIHEALPNVFEPSSIRFTRKGLTRSLTDASIPVMMNGLYSNSSDNAWGLEFSVGEIGAGNSLRVYLAARLKPGAECRPNKVTIFNDDADSNNSNHLSVANCVKEEVKVDFSVDMIDPDPSEDGVMPKHLTGGSFQIIEGKEGEYEFKNMPGSTWQSNLNESGTTGTYVSAQKLSLGKYYWLVEKKAPHDASNGRNYVPLSEPILFRLVQDKAKNVGVEFYNRNKTQKCSAVNGWGSCSEIAESLPDRKSLNYVSIQVQRSPIAIQPELPKTGANGLIGLVSVGFLALFWGIVMMYRRSLALN